MQTNGTAAETIRGQVEATNPKGIKVGGRWFNFSQYGAEVARPERGQTVELIAAGKFIRSLEIVDGATEPRGPVSRSESAAPAYGTSRETTITRLAVLKAAAEFAASRSDAKSADVLAIAERWEAWVNR